MSVAKKAVTKLMNKEGQGGLLSPQTVARILRENADSLATALEAENWQEVVDYVSDLESDVTRVNGLIDANSAKIDWDAGLK